MQATPAERPLAFSALTPADMPTEVVCSWVYEECEIIQPVYAPLSEDGRDGVTAHMAAVIKRQDKQPQERQ